MATLRPDLVVTLAPSTKEPQAALTYPPTGTGTLVVAVHGAALKARGHRLTQLVELSDEDEVLWVGALDERSLVERADKAKRKGARELVAFTFFKGPRCWEIVRPGSLYKDPGAQSDAVWPLESPWVVLADSPKLGLLAAPLGTTGKEERWAHVIPAGAMPKTVVSDSGLHLLELNHVWQLPAVLPTVGEIARTARSDAQRVIRGYWRV